jgi:hypothetical protein
MPSNSGPAQLPVLENDDVRLLQAVWDGLDRSGQWPTFDAIDRTFLNRYDDLDLPELIARIPPAFLHGGRPQGGARADPNGQLSLTVAGAALCSGTEQVLQAVVTAARLGANAFRWGDPAEPAAVTFDQVIEELGLDLSAAEEKELGKRSAMLLGLEPWTTNSWINEGRWSYNVDRDIRLYDGVETFKEYWQARERQQAAQQAQTTGLIWGDLQLNVQQPSEAPANPVPEEGPSQGSHPVLVFLGVAASLFAILPTVIQATEAIWAQITGAGLLVLTVLLLLSCWFRWNRWPRMRKVGLAIAGVLALGIGVVLIIGNVGNVT